MKRFIPLIIALVSLVSCEKQNSAESTVNDEVNKFIYNGLDIYYLYKDDQSLFEKAFYEVNSGSPEDFFEKMTIAEDRFSWIVDDYNVLEAQFEGTSLTDGIDFSLRYIDDTQDKIVANVNYVANGSPAEQAGVLRGDFFTTINGSEMDNDNYQDLLSLDNYTLDRLTSDLIFIETVSLTKEEFTENPIGESKTIEIEGQNIGYLLYNSFIGGSEENLNVEFLNFKANAINELVLDLRYNGGGSVNTTVALAGMITGQFIGDVFVKEQWNNEAQAYFESELPDSLITNFIDETVELSTPLNSLGLTKLYVISSDRTASASEMVINSLSPYIEVIHIGQSDGTVGKSQASTTLYDSENYNRQDVNTSHTYAMQPLIYKSVNVNDVSVPFNGLTPDVIAEEDITNLGVLGDVDEPLLSVAISLITGNTATTTAAKRLSNNAFGKSLGSNKMFSPTYQKMYDN